MKKSYKDWDVIDRITHYAECCIFNECMKVSKENIKSIIELVYMDDLIETISRRLNEKYRFKR